MKMTLTYGSSYELIITLRTGEVFKTDIANAPLQDAVNYAETVFEDATGIRSNLVAMVVICDSNTGEILAECTPDSEPTEVEEDWGYNEDMGFDPYMGCYTDDC